MDKFLLLVRRYVAAGWGYLQGKEWDAELVEEYLDVLEGIVNEKVGKVSDGLRYHVLDCWVEELDKVDRDGVAPVQVLMRPVREVAEKGRTKVLRQHAKEVLKDGRLEDWKESRGGGEDGNKSTGEDDEASE